MSYLIDDYSRTLIYVTDGWREWYWPKFAISMEVSEPNITISWDDISLGSPKRRSKTFDYTDVSGYGYANPSSATDLKNIIDGYIISGWTDIPAGGDLLNAKAQLLSHDGASDTILAAGTNEYYLKRDNVEATGLIWVPASDILSAANIGAAIDGSAAATPNDTDLVATADTSILKKITWTNVKAFLKTYFDTLYKKVTPNKSTADQVTAAVVLANITNLSLAIAASQTIYFRCMIHYGASATNGSRYAVTIPASATMKVAYNGTQTTAVSFGATSWLTTSGTEGSTVGIVANAISIVVLEGWVTTGATSGTIQIQGRSANAANTVTWYSGSMITGQIA